MIKTINDTIALLEKCKLEHWKDKDIYSEGTHDCTIGINGVCTCGATETNAEIDAMIARLKE